MCCRCYIDYLKDEELRRMYDLVPDKTDLKTEGEIFPTDNMVVISKTKDNKISCFKMKWGYNVNKINIFNARMESIYSKEIFSDGINNRRCVIPINNYFEWKKDDKVKYKIKDQENVTYLLGIYHFENNIPVFTILTKDASLKMSYIHDRMPLAIKKNQISSWINNSDLSKTIMLSSVDSFNYDALYKK